MEGVEQPIKPQVITSPQVTTPEAATPPPSGNTPALKSSSFFSFFNKPVGPVRVWIILLAVMVIGGIAIGSVLPKQEAPAPSTSSLPPVKPAFTLTLESPSDGEVITDNQITIRGKTSPNTPVVFYTEESENSVESDAKGQFEGTVSLQSGLNTLTVTAFSQDGEEKSTTLDLVYDDEAQVKGAKTSKEPPGLVKKEDSTPKAMVGGIEGVTPNSIILEEKKLKKRVETAVDEHTKITGRDKHELKLEALKSKDKAAIIASDSGAATGGAHLKKATKIFVQEATLSAQAKRRAIQGLITNIEGGVITVTHQIQRERIYTLLTSEQTVIKLKGVTDATLADLQVGQRIAAVGDLNEAGGLVAKRIHVIPGKATGIFKKQPLATPSATATPATSSATPSATPTATVSATPSPTQEATPTATPTVGP